MEGSGLGGIRVPKLCPPHPLPPFSPTPSLSRAVKYEFAKYLSVSSPSSSLELALCFWSVEQSLLSYEGKFILAVRRGFAFLGVISGDGIINGDGAIIDAGDLLFWVVLCLSSAGSVNRREPLPASWRFLLQLQQAGVNWVL